MVRRMVGVERHDGGVALVELQRPEKRNALSIELRIALADALDSLAADDELRCAVLTGAGPAFCAGMDVTQFGGDEANRRLLVETSERLFDTVARFPLPLIAAVNGPAIAGGFVLALLCDVRIAGLRARFGFPEVGRHIPPSYAAARAALPPATARWLCLTGRVLDAGEAERHGVVQEVIDDAVLRERAVQLATEIAGASAWTLRELKRRILVDHERLLFPLLEDETRVLRERVLHT
jgi:enoyl-CoA hydratase/carnithine racemase